MCTYERNSKSADMLTSETWEGGVGAGMEGVGWGGGGGGECLGFISQTVINSIQTVIRT